MTATAEIDCMTTSVGSICAKLRQFGVARLPAFAAPGDVAAAMDEAQLAVSRYANYLNPYGPCARFTLGRLPARLSRSRDLVRGKHLPPLPRRFVRSRQLIDNWLLRETTAAYLGPSSGFLEVVAFTQDCHPDPDAVYGRLHYDRRHQLKFILYLSAADETNGAFGCIPGSHRLGRRLFNYGWRRVLGLKTRDTGEIERAAAAVAEDDPTYHQVPCVFEKRPRIGSDGRRMILSGPAGTLVIFDTHLLHFGGFVSSPSKPRWTLKGHSFALID